MHSASFLSEEPSLKAKNMTAFESSTFAFVHTSQEVVQTLTIHLNPLQPKSNSIGKFPRQYLSSSFRRPTKLNRERAPEPDISKGNDAVGTIKDIEIENVKSSDQSRQLEPPCISSKGVRSICKDSNEEQPSESEFISRAVHLQLFLHAR